MIDYFGYKKHFEGLQRSDSNSRRKRNSQPAPQNGASDEPKYVQTLAKEKQQANKKEMLGKRKDELVYVSPLLEGFALKNKQWREFINLHMTKLFTDDSSSSELLRR